MKAKLITPKLVISAILFFTICLIGCVFDMHAKALTSGQIPDTTVRLKLVGLENDTNSMHFQIFSNGDESSALAFPQSTFKYAENKGVDLNSRNIVTIKCSKGSYQSVFIQDGGAASGIAEDDYDGPFYVSMWLNMPNVPESLKTHVRYVVKKGQTGSIGLRIGQKGDYRFVAYDNVKFVS